MKKISVKSRSNLPLYLNLFFLVAFGLLLGIARFTYLSVKDLVASNQILVEHQKQHLRFGKLLSLIQDLDASTQHYLLTSKERHLGPYRESLAAIPKVVKELQLKSDDRDQRALKELRRLIDLKIIDNRKAIESRRSFGLVESLQVVFTGKGRVLMDDIRQWFRKVDGELAQRDLIESQETIQKVDHTLRQLGWAGLTSLIILITALLIILRGLKQQMQMEVGLREANAKALAASELKSAFVANVSHEIRTPLNAILGMTRLLTETPMNEEQSGFLKDIQTASTTLLTVINDILDFSKIEAGKVQIEYIDTDMPSILTSATHIIAAEAKRKGLSVELHIDPQIPRVIRIDPGRLQQILVNLLGNAVKFTSRGDIHLGATMLGKTDRGVEIKVAVRDSGIGIPKKSQSAIFGKFNQADVSTTRKFGGTGLGLSITKGLVEQMGGQIGFDSEEGIGTTFWFVLRLQPGDQNFDLKKTVVARAESKSLAGRILIGEDNLLNQKLDRILLERLGHFVEIVGDGTEVLAKLEENQYDVLLLDCHMPKKDGYETAQDIRKHPSQKNPAIPIIALTADAQEENKQKCLEAGMNFCLSKPIDAEALVKALNEWMKPTPTALPPTMSVVQSPPGTPRASETPAPMVPTPNPTPAAGTLLIEIRPALDATVLDGLKEMEKLRGGFLADLIDTFEKTSDHYIDELATAFHAGDAERIAFLAHAFRSSAASMGAITTSELCAELETSATKKSIAVIKRTFHMIELEYDRAMDELAELRTIYQSKQKAA